MMKELRDLAATAPQFTFFSLVRLLEHLLSVEVDSDSDTDSAGEESPAVSFRHVADLAFPTSDIASLEVSDERARVTLQCFGLVGTASPMPPEWTEDILRADDEGSLRAFCDVFHDRAARVLYAIWKTRALEGGFDLEGRDPLSESLRALVGVDAWAPTERQPLAPMVALGLTDHQRGRPQTIDATSAEQLLQRLYPRWNVRIESNVRRIVALTPAEASCLGAQRNRLGLDVFCGNDAEDAENMIRVHVGPLDAETYSSLMPGGAAHSDFTMLLEQLFSVHSELEVRVSRRDAPPCALGAAVGAQLGLDTYCATEEDAVVRVRVPLDPTAVTRTFVL